MPQGSGVLLNDQLLACDTLDVFPLPSDYVVKYNGRRLVDHKVVKRGQQLGNTWMSSYNFMNIPVKSVEEDDSLVSAIHPLIDDIIFTPAGDISIGSASLLTGGTLLLGLCCCSVCCLLCPACRQCILSGCSTILACTRGSLLNHTGSERTMRC